MPLPPPSLAAEEWILRARYTLLGLTGEDANHWEKRGIHSSARFDLYMHPSIDIPIHQHTGSTRL